MNKTLLKKLLKNALRIVEIEQANAGCNDLFPKSVIISDLSPDELEIVKLQWMLNNPDDVKDYGEALAFDTQVLKTIKQELEKLNL